MSAFIDLNVIIFSSQSIVRISNKKDPTFYIVCAELPPENDMHNKKTCKKN